MTDERPIFISPHNDDETLFGFFTLMRFRPLVVVVFDSYLQPARGSSPATAAHRKLETARAMKHCNCPLEFVGIPDDFRRPESVADRIAESLLPFRGRLVFAPAVEVLGHPHHNLVGTIAGEVFPHVQRYLTYTQAGKSIGRLVPFERDWVRLKLLAMAEYQSQILEPSCTEHFVRDLREYML